MYIYTYALYTYIHRSYVLCMERKDKNYNFMSPSTALETMLMIVRGINYKMSVISGVG